MEGKLPILLFKILICTLLISFKTESQITKEREKLKEFMQYLERVTTNSPKQIDNPEDDKRLQLEREIFEMNQKLVEDVKNFKFTTFKPLDNVDANMLKEFQVPEHENEMLREDYSKHSDYDFKPSDIPYLILGIVIFVVAAFVIGGIISGVVYCVKKKTHFPSCSRLWIIYGHEKPSGNGSITQESSGDKTRLINA